MPRTRTATATQTDTLPTIREVAALAGVSVGTVSKALNGQGHLRPETRAKVQAASAQLGYQPNDLVLSMRRGRSLTVGLITTDSYGRFSMPLVEGIEEALGAAQFNVFLCNAAADSERERRHVKSLLSKRVDGIIVTSRRTDPRPALDLSGARLPVLYVYAQVEGGGAPCMLPDDVGGGHLAAEHLLSLGHTRIAHVTGPERFLAVRERLRGATDALQARGLLWQDGAVLHGEWSEAWGHEAAGRLLQCGATAAFCGNDQIARGLVDGLRERGAQVPSDVAVVGFDNWAVIAAATRPPLTTIDMNLHELGRQAGLRLLGMVNGALAPPDEHVSLPCRLVVRASCGATDGEVMAAL